jgi:hypothetical protein
MKSWWLSWYHSEGMGPFEYHGPWWVSGARIQPWADTIVAAVQAEDEAGAWEIIRQSYDVPPPELEERFISDMGDKEPYSDRFPQAEWMVWQ